MDDVVARGVGVISTREGTYLPITVPLAPLLLARTYARIYFASSFSPPSSTPFFALFPAEETVPYRSLFIYSHRVYILVPSRSAVFARREFWTSSLPPPPLPLQTRVRSPLIRFLPLL